MADEQPKLDVVGDVEWPDGRNPFEYVDPKQEQVEEEETPTAAETPDQPEQTPSSEEPKPEPAPEQAAPEQPAEPAEEQPAAEGETPEEPEVEIPENDPFAAYRDEKGLILGKWKTGEDWAAGTRQADAWGTQQSQARAQAEREAAEARRILTELQPFMPLIQQAVAQGGPEALQQQQQQQPVPQVPEDLDLSDPQVLTTFLTQRDAQIRQQLQGELQQQMAQQFQSQQQQFAEQQTTQSQIAEVHRFYERFPDAAPGEPLNQSVAQVVAEYRAAGIDEFSTYNDENLEVAYTLVKNPRVKEMIDRFDIVPNRDAVQRATEMVADPNLANYVAANPAALTETDDDGWAYAKTLAALPGLLQGAQNGAQANVQQQQQQARTMAHLEAGGSGAPVQAAPGERPKTGNDLFMETVVKPWKEQTTAFTGGTS